MLNTQQKIKFSEYAVLYDMLIPKDNKYRLIDELIDFSFIYDELKDKYCPDNGRTAADPIKALSKERYKIEAKNSELKNAHGYDKADSYGISALELQGAVTIFVVNLKRIMKMMAK